MAKYASALITGGAGFIGTHLARKMAALCESCLIVDNMHPQIHGPLAQDPLLPEGIDFTRLDICDREALRDVVLKCQPDLVVHLAAETGTGQSYDEVIRYNDVNVMGTAYLVEALRQLPDPAKRRRLVLASSRAVYGEGAYRDRLGQVVTPHPRSSRDMADGRFDPTDETGEPLTAIATPETASVRPSSIYASTKLMQEFLLRQSLDGSSLDVVTLRFQNVYGEGQSLKNPYTGVLSIFASLVEQGKTLDIFEDGNIVRDFVHVSDIASAISIAALVDPPPGGVINIGTGRGISIVHAAQVLLETMGRPRDQLAISGRFRAGDVRHAVADVSRAASLLGWSPSVSFETGVAALVSSLPKHPHL